MGFSGELGISYDAVWAHVGRVGSHDHREAVNERPVREPSGYFLAYTRKTLSAGETFHLGGRNAEVAQMLELQYAQSAQGA